MSIYHEHQQLLFLLYGLIRCIYMYILYLEMIFTGMIDNNWMKWSLSSTVMFQIEILYIYLIKRLVWSWPNQDYVYHRKKGEKCFQLYYWKMTITINHHVNQDIKNTPNFWVFFYQMIVYSIADDILKS